jgi:YVTN family beta-propeller protein
LPGFELPSAVAVNAATDTIYVSTAGGVVPIEGLTNRVLLPILVGTNPQGVAVDDKTNTIYVAVATDLAKGGPALVVIDGSKDAVTGSVPLDDVGQGVAFDAASGQVFVAIPGLNQLAIVDPVNLKVVGTRLVGASPHGVAADNGIVYVTNNRDNYVFVLDAFTLEEKARVPVGKLPEGIDVDPARGIVYVANAGEQTMSLIETGKFTVFATLQVAPAGASPRDAAVNRMTGFVYVPTTDGKLRVVQP